MRSTGRSSVRAPLAAPRGGARRAAKPIVHACDMVPSEMSNEATEIITMAVDKYVTNGATRDARRRGRVFWGVLCVPVR